MRYFKPKADSPLRGSLLPQRIDDKGQMSTYIVAEHRWQEYSAFGLSKEGIEYELLKNFTEVSTEQEAISSN